MNLVVLLFGLGFVASLLLVRGLLAWAARLQIVDVPNERSSHTRPTPRGGGLAAVVVFVVGALALGAAGLVSGRDLLALLPGAVGVAVVGLLDDRRGVAPLARLAVHLGAAAWFLVVLGGLPPTGITWVDATPLLGGLVGMLAIAWGTNLFNFMDGIDGIAGSQAVFIAAGVALVGIAGGVPGLAALGALLAGGAAGFLAWNWPPARIFMGDVGSGFFGHVLSCLLVLTLRADRPAIAVALALPALFLVDATVTLLRRGLRGAPPHQAHRTHAYQWLSRRWGSHLRVSLLYVALDLLLVAPVAAYAWRAGDGAGAVVLVMLAAFSLLALAAGAGRAEGPRG